MKSVFIFITALLGFSAAAQQITWGPLEKATGRVSKLLPVSGMDFFTTRYTGGTLLGSMNLSYHNNFEQLTVEKIVTKVEGSAGTYEGAVYFNSKVQVFLSDKRDGMNVLYRQEYSTSCTPESEAIEVARYELPKGFGNKGAFSIKRSQNAQYVCVEYAIPARNSNFDRYGFKVFNANFEIVSEGEYESEYQSRQSDVTMRYLSDDGEYYLLAKVYNTNDRGKVRDYSSLDKVILMSAVKGEIETMELALSTDKHITDVTFFKDGKGNLRCTGLYGNDKNNGTAGIFYMEIDFDSKDVVNTAFSEFTKDFITQGWTERAKKKAAKKEAKGNAPQLWSYDLSEIFTVDDDGSMCGVMEQYYVTVHTYTDSRGMTTTTYYYHYNDLIIYKINPNGEFEFKEKVQKIQTSSNDDGYLSSYASYVTDDNKLVLMFNDNLKNYSEEGNFIEPAVAKDLEPASFRKKTNCVAKVEVDLASGSISRNTMFNRSEAEAYAVPKLFATNYTTNEMLIVLRVALGKKEKFGVIKF